MSWISYAIILMVITLIIAIVAIPMGKRKHWTVQTVAVILCGLALYCHVQAEANGEYHKLSQQIAEPLVKKVLQPFALSNLGQQTMSALRYTIQLLEQMISFIDDNKISLTVALTGLIYLIVWTYNRNK